TIHTIDSIEVITRLRKIGVSNYDIGSTLATSLSQRLVRRVCKNCAVEREFTEEEKQIINGIAKKYGVEYDFTGKHTYTPVGCSKCNNSGFYGRIGIFEILNISEKIKEAIIKDESSIEIRRKAIEEGYRPLVIDGFNKVLDGYTTLQELNSKLVIY
ncbi:MAG: type II secretion system protein GspE, partial [Clostridia bacterium]